ncbi:hypothetical protein FBU59_003453 [Linderina macrospora]|uniref:Uncharacterized protein n=1 Tax=Linderina macrospora TaxID=4868 RepID=A0ACC1J8F9_9FUNG|nr:hypothetical protein FBU59_003453 [Linderina macrospora]
MSSEAPQQPEPVPVANQAVPTEPVDSLLELRGVQLEMLRRAPNLIVYDDLHVRVSREVQRQVESGSDVNWAAVAEAVGATVLECLENNTYDQGKRSWEYNFREFTWDLPNRLRDFVSEHYPKPIQPNFTAVSNYMWIVKDDCITMRRLTTGRFKWTQEMLAKATRLKEKGRDNAFIAKRLSPQLYLASHEFYKKKVMALNYYNIIDGIIERGEAAINIAKELDLPYHIVHQLVLKRQAKEHSGTWTKIEIKKLLDFVNSAKGRRDWKHCASIIGTKSSSQCYSKWLHMRD